MRNLERLKTGCNLQRLSWLKKKWDNKDMCRLRRDVTGQRILVLLPLKVAKGCMSGHAC